MDRRTFLVGTTSSAIAAGAGRYVPGVGAQAAGPDVPAGFTRLRVIEGALTVDGKSGKAYRIQQDDGVLGYTGAKGERFRVALENATKESVSIHWHGLILSNGQDGVPYVTQAPIKPGEQRLYDFPLVQAGTYWMHSHFGLQEQPLMTAPLILRDPRAPRPDEKEVVVILNDFTTQDPAAILARLQGRPGSGALSPPPMPGGGASGSKMGGMKMGTRGRDLNDVTYDAFWPTAARSPTPR